jgi:hypothetical protein
MPVIDKCGPAREARHIFLCLLAYYVEWHMREAWRELMFADADQAAKATRDPVAPAKRSKAALVKATLHTLDDGTPVHSFATLLGELADILTYRCHRRSVLVERTVASQFTFV